MDKCETQAWCELQKAGLFSKGQLSVIAQFIKELIATKDIEHEICSTPRAKDPSIFNDSDVIHYLDDNRPCLK